MNKTKIALSMFVVWLVLISCGLPDQVSATQTPFVITATAADAATPQPTASTAIPVATAPDATATNAVTPTVCSPTVVTGSNINVRSGPGTAYDIAGQIPTGGSAEVVGKSTDGSWWYINFPGGPGGHAWISASVVTPNCVPDTIVIVAAPPIPTAASTLVPTPVAGTCKPGYTFRNAGSGDHVCVTPSQKSAAAAQNAAAASHLATATYGPSTCVAGYVWRSAWPGDVVCVTPAENTQVAADNAAAAGRINAGGAYGPNSCVSGYVWREGRSTDLVCVTAAQRSQVAADNAAAASRVVAADACASGYVWRSAFGGDKVCVIPSDQAAAAAENADGPGHTY